MTTIQVSVKNKKDAGLLIRMLKKVSFVERVEEIKKQETQIGQYHALKDYLQKNSNPGYMNHIEDPIRWQQDLRNEWK
jgi:hypothetical protein